MAVGGSPDDDCASGRTVGSASGCASGSVALLLFERLLVEEPGSRDFERRWRTLPLASLSLTERSIRRVTDDGRDSKAAQVPGSTIFIPTKAQEASEP